jgi:tetratricopeptide (TPR) repeat protein
VKQKLNAYEKGKISLESFTKNEEDCEELINYYLFHMNEISTKAKLPISRCYALSGMYPDAVQLAQEYVNVYSNDWRGWRILGGSYFLMSSFDKSIQAYKNAVRLGDKGSYEPLAGAAIKSDRMDIVREMVPQLMALKDAKDTPEENRLHLMSILLIYSAKADRKDIFTKTLEGADMEKILQDDDIKLNVTSGCQIFQGKDIDEIRQEMEVATQNDLKTNSVSGLSP